MSPDPQDSLSLVMYLYEAQDRERESLRRLFSGLQIVYQNSWQDLGIPYPGWFGLNLPKDVLLRSVGDAGSNHPGDVDILVGSAISNGGENWTASVDEFSALEAKVSWFGPSNDLHATKEGRLPRAYRQAHDLLRLGVRRAGLLWIVVTQPVRLPGVHDWLLASWRAGDAFDAIRRLPGYQALSSQDDPIGFAVFPWGAVAPGEERTEDWAGAGAPQIVTRAQPNPYLEDARVLQAQEAIRATLTATFGDSRFHNLYRGRVFLLCCEGCRRLFVTGNPRQRRCDRCGG